MDRRGVCFFATLAWGFFAAIGAKGENLEAWQSGAARQEPLSFKSWLKPGIVESRNFPQQQVWSVFESPKCRLFGHLDFSSYPSSNFPLKVRFLYRALDQAMLDPAAPGLPPGTMDWTTPLHLSKASVELGNLLEERQIEVVSPAQGGSVPVWAPSGISISNMAYNGAGLYSLLVEVIGHNGTILARQRLIEAVNIGEPGVVVLSRKGVGAEPYMVPMKVYGEVVDASDLPLDILTYKSVSVLWLDDITLHDPRYDNAFWQRIFLIGTTVIGHGPEVSELATRLGINPDQPLLLGGLWSVDTPSRDLVTYINSDERGADRSLEIPADENPFTKNYKFAERQTRQLDHFSFWMLIGFTVFELLVIFGSGYLLPGYQRVWRWAFVPGAALAYTAVALLLVHAAVDFRPEVQIVQEIDSVEGWDQAQALTDVSRIAFDHRTVAMTSPAPAESLRYFLPWRGGLFTSADAGDLTQFSATQAYGRLFNSTTVRPFPAESPCRMIPDGQIEATRSLRGAWVWDGRVWRVLGTMLPDHPVDLASAPIMIDPVRSKRQKPVGNVEYLPQTVIQMGSPDFMQRLKGTNIGLFLAVDEQPTPIHLDDESTSEVHHFTLLVHQFKLPKP